MRHALLITFVAALALAGCVKAPKEIKVDVDAGGWREAAAGFTGRATAESEQGVVFHAFDTLAYPGKPVDVVASVQSADDMKGLAGVTVSFFSDETPVGQAVTGADGMAVVKTTPPTPGYYELTARITAVSQGQPQAMLSVTPAPVLVAAWPKDSKIVVIDLDRTVVDSGFYRVLSGRAEPVAGSAEACQRIAKRYCMLYLTQRPDVLSRRSKAWLSQNGYPSGPLLVSDMKQALGGSGKVKTGRLGEVCAAFPGLAVGIGDKLSDAQAYIDNGMTAYLIPRYKDESDDLRDLAKDIRKVSGGDRMQVVTGWGEIEQGIFEGTKFPPEAFAQRLERRAVELDRKKKDKDDD